MTMSDDELAGEGDTVVLAPGEEEEPLKKLTHVHQGVLQAFMVSLQPTAFARFQSSAPVRRATPRP